MSTAHTALKQNVIDLAAEQNSSPLAIISQLQVGAAAIGDDATLDALCDLKWEFI